MITRAVALVGGLAGAAGLSQYPEFSQQYTQHLSGQVEALGVVVADFDASAARSDLSRDAALAQLQGSDFLDDRRADMTRTFARFTRIQTHLDALSTATPLQRLVMPHRLGDVDTFKGTWAQFKPALPLSWAGGLAAVLGFLAGSAILGGLLSLVTWPLRKKRRALSEAPLAPELRGLDQI